MADKKDTGKNTKPNDGTGAPPGQVGQKGTPLNPNNPGKKK